MGGFENVLPVSSSRVHLVLVMSGSDILESTIKRQ